MTERLPAGRPNPIPNHNAHPAAHLIGSSTLAQAAEEQSRIRRGLPRKAPKAETDSGQPKRKKGAVKRGKFSTRHAHGVAKERSKAKYNKNKDKKKAAAQANKAAAA